MPAVVREHAGDKPPAVLARAVKALAACRTLDEAAHWANKADALKAWARIYADEGVDREARALKLHAYRRIGELAVSMRPWKPLGRGSTKGPRSLLQEHGLSKSRANQALGVARVSKEKFNELANADRPPSPSSVIESPPPRNAAWHALQAFLNAARHTSPKALALHLSDRQHATTIALCKEGIAWLTLFERAVLALESPDEARNK